MILDFSPHELLLLSALFAFAVLALAAGLARL